MGLPIVRFSKFVGTIGLGLLTVRQTPQNPTPPLLYCFKSQISEYQGQ
jgi:hypothetical protein